MNRFFLIILITLLYNTAKSQTFDDKIDSFTGEKTQNAVIHLGKSVPKMEFMTIFFGSVNEKKFIGFYWTAFSGAFGSFNMFNGLKQDQLSLLMKLDNGDILRFKPDSTLNPYIGNYARNSIMCAAGNITNDQLKELMNHKISDLRVGIRGDNGANIEGPLFTNGNRVEIQKAAAHMIGLVLFDETDIKAEK